MRVIFKTFEIRSINNTDFEIVNWHDEQCSTTCYVVAYLKWNKKEPCYEFESCGLRFLKFYTDGLAEFINAFAEFQEKRMTLLEDD